MEILLFRNREFNILFFKFDIDLHIFILVDWSIEIFNIV